MELQALLVLCGVGVVGAAVLLLMGLFSASGTSYEEAIAQQRRATTELLALAENKAKPKKNNKKAIKKLAKKERKENTAVTTGSELESEVPAESGVDEDPVPTTKPHVEFSPPVVVDVSVDAPPNVKIRKRGKDPKIKPILINKEDPSCINDPSTPPSPTGSTVSNHFEEIHPKDEFELLHSTMAAEKQTPEKKEDVVEKKEIKVVKQAKNAKLATKQSPPTETVKEEAVRERPNNGDGAKEQRKAKKVEKKTNEDVVDASREEVVPPLNAPQPSELTTDKLLKQALATAPAPPAASPPGGKNKKKKTEPNVLSLMAGDGGGVNVGELVRVVREAALSRTEVQILTDALLNKHHDLLPEHSEWTEGPNDPMQKLKKQLADKEKALADEVEASQALHAKLKELRASLNAERSRATNAARAGEQAAAAAAAARAELHTLQARLQRLLDDNHALAQDKLMLQSKLGAEGEVQAQRVQLEMHIQRLSESEAGLVQQLNALQAELQARVLEAGQARCDAAAARDTGILAQQHAAELAQQLQEANRAYGELEQQRQCAAHAEQLAQQELKQAQERLADLQNEVQRLTSRVQTAESNADKLKEDLEKHNQQLSTELATLREQLSERESELAELKLMKAVPAQNGLSPANTNSDQHKAAELAKVESMVESLRSELAAAQHSNRDQREQLKRLEDQLHTYQDKNNELRTKNWKVMEALQSAEKALQMKSATALPAQDSLREAIAKAQEAQYNEMASILRATCPSAVPNSSVGREWLQMFADNLKKQLEKNSTPEPSSAPAAPPPPSIPASDARLDDLQAQNEHLQNLVDKYKRIIDDTEGVLSHLQQNVTTEEQRWAQQLADKQHELDELRQRTITQMQKKIDSLQEELDEAKSTSQNHTFADKERLTEERLMADLSEKCKVDVCNGPLQVGLEEK